jgi:hypothetical protein
MVGSAKGYKEFLTCYICRFREYPGEKVLNESFADRASKEQMEGRFIFYIRILDYITKGTVLGVSRNKVCHCIIVTGSVIM